MNGRPPSDIDQNQIQLHRNAGLRWSDISQILNVSARTLERWRTANNYEVQLLTK